MFTLDQCPPEVRELKYNTDKLNTVISRAQEAGARIPFDVPNISCNAYGCVSAFTNPPKRGNLYAAPPTIEAVKSWNWKVVDAIRRIG